MKNKIKNIIAGLGIGLTIAGSGLIMTGCTETPVTDDQVEKVFTALENANEFMTDTITNLTEQNQVLADHKAKLEDIVVEMEKQNREQLYEDIVKLYEHSVRRMQLNLDNIWDNMKVSFSAAVYGGFGNHRDEIGQSTEYFKLENGTNVILLEMNDVDGVYDYHDSTEESEEITINPDSTGGTIDGEFTVKIDFDYWAATWWTALDSQLTNRGFFKFNTSEITNVRVLENGNYLISVYQDNMFGQDIVNMMYEIEITTDGYLVKLNGFYYDEYSFEKSIINYDFEYDVLTEVSVQAKIDAYQQSQVASN